MTTLLGTPFDETLDTATAFVKEVVITATRGSDIEVIEPESGRFTQDARRAMRWDGEITVPVSTGLVPTTPDDLLTPFGTEVKVDLGIVLASSAVATVPFGAYEVDGANVELSPDSRSVTLPLIGIGQRVAGYRFEEPLTLPSGSDLADIVNTVLADRTGDNPGLSDTGVTIVRARTFGLDPNTDPWRELSDTLAGFGYRLYYDRSANPILDQRPEADASAAQPFSGRLSAATSFDRRPANVIVARGEAVDGTPVQATVIDDDPSSPTYAGTAPGSSPYGRITRYYASPLLSSLSQATQAARTILASEAAAAATWTVTKAYDPTVDPDDVISVPLDAETTLPLQVDSVTVDIAGETTLETRAISDLDE